MSYANEQHNSLLPWLHSSWEYVLLKRQNQRLPHALLFLGASGLGQWEFAHTLSAALLCKKPDADGFACLHCQACHLFAAKTHPDFIVLQPEQAGQMIKIDQVRDAVNVVNETPLMGGYRVIIIHPADAMNHHAVNALLKTLEEPTPNTLLILISDQSARLPATITSRCQKVIFPKPQFPVAKQWLQQHVSNVTDEQIALALQLASFAPLKARALLNDNAFEVRHTVLQGLAALSEGNADPLQLAQEWHTGELGWMFYILQSVLRDILRLKLTKADVINRDFVSVLQTCAGRLCTDDIMRYIERVQWHNTNRLNSQNINRQLLLEEILIDWRALYVSC